MPPQSPASQNQTPPSSPNDPYSFILKDKPKAKRSLPHLSKPLLFGAGLLVLLLVIILFSSLRSGNKSAYQQIEDVMAAQQEIIRVDGLVPGLAKDPNTPSLAATINASLQSSQSQLSAYLAKNKIKYKPQILASHKNAQTDTTLKTAAQNNNFEAAYFSYLQTGLQKYGTTLKTTSLNVGPKAKVILNKAYQDNSVLLSAPQFAVTTQ